MLKRVILGLTSTLILSSTLLIAEAPTATHNVVKDERYTAASKLLESMGAEKSYSETLDKMMESQQNMLPPSIKNDKIKMEKYSKVLNSFINKYVGWKEIKEDMIRMYAKHYTASELQDLSNFYKTPTGQKTIKLMPQIATESMQISQSRLIPHIPELQQEIAKVMKD